MGYESTKTGTFKKEFIPSSLEIQPKINQKIGACDEGTIYIRFNVNYIDQETGRKSKDKDLVTIINGEQYKKFYDREIVDVNTGLKIKMGEMLAGLSAVAAYNDDDYYPVTPEMLKIFGDMLNESV